MPPPDPAKVFPAWKGCQAEVPDIDLFESNDRPEQGRVPDNFTPVRAVRCELDDARKTEGFGGVVQRAADIDGLLAELARPSEHSEGPISCLDWGWQRPWLFLLDADGRWVLPQVPADSCGHPLSPEKGNTLPSWRRYDAWPLDLTERDKVLDIGCQPRVPTGGILNDPDYGNDHREAIPATELDGQITAICRYRKGPRLHPELSPEGHFLGGRKLTKAEGTMIKAAIISEPAKRCRETATTYATLEGIGDMITIAVELDGCQRMLETYSSDSPHRAGAAQPELISLLRD